MYSKYQRKQETKSNDLAEKNRKESREEIKGTSSVSFGSSIRGHAHRARGDLPCKMRDSPPADKEVG